MLKQISNLGKALDSKSQKAIRGGKVLNPDDIPDACITHTISDCPLEQKTPEGYPIFYWNGHCCLPVGITQVH